MCKTIKNYVEDNSKDFFILVTFVGSLIFCVTILALCLRSTKEASGGRLNQAQPHTEHLFHKTVDAVITKAEYQALGQWLYVTMQYEDVESRVQVNPYDIKEFQDLLYQSHLNSFNEVTKETPLRRRALLYTRTSWDKVVSPVGLNMNKS